MKLPHAEAAIANEDKIRNYLLHPRHPANLGKAEGFARFGFFRWRWKVLQAALLAHASTSPVIRIIPSADGAKYVLEGMLEGANGRSPWLRSVWKLKTGEHSPRLVTAHLIPPPKEPS